jgi:CDP-diacylglycerol---serine O-phosphatidyltransferase
MNYLPYAAFLLPLFAALRLAKFNTDPSQSHDFKGLPTPAAAFFVLSLPLISSCDDVKIHWLNDMIQNQWILLSVAVFLPALMVSPIRIFSLKFTGLRWKGNRARYLLIIFALLLFPFIRFAAVPFILLAYLLLSLLKPDGTHGP